MVSSNETRSGPLAGGRFMIRMPLGSIAVLFGSALSACGASPSFEITVAAGRHERTNVPVRVRVPLGLVGDAKIASVPLTGPDGRSIPAQWARPGLISGGGDELHFSLPHLSPPDSIPLR